MYILLYIQEQYAFIHDALSDYLTCGDTSILAYELREEISKMEEVDKKTGRPNYHAKFQVCIVDSQDHSVCIY